MFPLLPILILLLLGPANADRLAAEGRLPQALLAVHLAQTAPAKACAVAPVEQAAEVVARSSAPAPSEPRAFRMPLGRAAVLVIPGCPPRAGPAVA